MLTPTFECKQDEEFIYLSIDCPYIKASEVQIDISGNEFRLYINPYFLKLNFPGGLIEDGRESSAYDIASGKLLLKIPKEERSQFKDLDFITKLLDIKKPSSAPIIEVLGEELNYDASISFIDKNGDASPAHEVSTIGYYGFNNQYRDASMVLNSLCREILELDDLSTSTKESRIEFRTMFEDAKFDPEYYCHDLHNLEEIQIYLNYRPKTWKLLRKFQSGELELVFTDSEREQMKNLPNKEFLIDDVNTVYLSLLDILFAYSYNERVTEGENTVESGWTICKLSGTLCAFNSFETLEQVGICCFRRALCFPLYRNYELASLVWKDMVILLKLGKRAILKALLKIKSVLAVQDQLYILDRIYITDYCVWIQSASDSVIAQLASKANHYIPKKEDLGLGLVELEDLCSLDS